MKRKPNFRVVVKKYRGINELTPIPADAKIIYCPPAYAEGSGCIEQSKTAKDWVKIGREYMRSYLPLTEANHDAA